MKEDLGPDAPFGDIARELGKRWKALTDDDKGRFLRAWNEKRRLLQ